MLNNHKTFPLTLALLLSFGVCLEPTLAIEDRQLTVAQAQEKETTFPLPDSMPEGSVVKISSSRNVEQINNSLKQKFEEQFSGAKVEVNSTDSDAALEEIVAKKADLAAISRPLTEAEEAQGFKTVPINREKIAIIVGENNPYNGNLTIEQFAKIFRGEITNWSEIGGESQPIKVIDLVSTDDTRRSFPNYPVFQNAEFKTGTNAHVLSNSEVEGIVKELSTDGISYAPVSAVEGIKGAKVVVMHKTLPDDPRYPFSQPNLYVYQGEPNDAVKGFLGFVTAQAGQGVIQETIASAKPLPGVSTGADSTTATAPTTSAEKAPTDSTAATAPTTSPGDSGETAPTAPETTTENTPADSNSATATEQKSKGWWWFLLPLALLIPLLAFLFKKGDDSKTTAVGDNEDGRELVGAGVTRPSADSDRDNNNNGIVAGTALATGLGAAAIANRRNEQSDFPEKIDLDATVEGVRNRFDDVTTNINTPEMPNIGGAVDGVRNRFDDVTTNINTPEMPKLENIQGSGEDNLNALDDLLNSEPQNVQSDNFLDKIIEKAGEIVDDANTKASEIKDNLINDSDRPL